MDHCKRKTAQIIGMIGIAILGALSKVSLAEISSPSSYERLKQDSALVIKNKLEPLLNKYCGEACQIIQVTPEIQESLSAIEDLGFEGGAEDEVRNSFYVERASIRIQVDGRVTSQNRDLLEKILVNHLSALGFTTKFDWAQIRLPRIGQSDTTLAELKKSLEDRLARTLQKIIETYCPEQCLISQIEINGTLITPDQAEGAPANQIFQDGDSLSYMKLNAAEVAIELDSSLDIAERAKILNVMKANTRFADPVEIKFNITEFPETYSSRQQRKGQEADDPYGLEKLRRTLILFRDLAGTKEIVTNTVASSTSDSKSSESMANQTSISERSLAESKAFSDGPFGADKSSQWIPGVPNWVIITLAAIIFIIIGLVVTTRFIGVSRDAKYMVQSSETAMQSRLTSGGEDFAAGADGKANGGDGKGEIGLRLKVEDLKEELIQVFMTSPRVAKETFSRMLSEEGVEVTSKYIHIFGQMIIFELLGDPNHSRDLFDLSEYYHTSHFEFTLAEELSLLGTLKTKVTANEIRVLTRKTKEQFDFLLKLDPTQVYNLIIDERSSLQSIVLTQLDHKKRRLVFDLFEGENKVALMRELCRADAIPKEYLANVAIAMQKKVLSKPEFDTENLRSADILLDLLEKSSLTDQRALMLSLNTTNPDAARALKQKLVTVEILPYLKDGHLLEIVLGLDREELVTFLAGTQPGIRDLLLNKAPEELAESWTEDLEHIAAVDESKFRIVEMKVLGRIRNLSNVGAISLLDINEMLFAPAEVGGFGGGTEQVARAHLIA